jgi:hypothetical protein
VRAALLGGGVMGADVSRVLTALGPQDTLLLTGATEGFVSGWLRKYRRRNLHPKLEVYRLEEDRYGAEGARKQLALQLAMGGSGGVPNVIVLAGDPDPVVQEEVMRLAALQTPKPIEVKSAGEFAASRVSA